MAKYQYQCSNCKEEYVIDKPMKEATREEICPQCNSVLKRVYTATTAVWKCSGAFVTDNK